MSYNYNAAYYVMPIPKRKPKTRPLEYCALIKGDCPYTYIASACDRCNLIKKT